MFLLKKIFQLRDKANPTMEKPFLEHLEDLRSTITKIVLTLIISMVACFSFQDQLMKVLREPVEEVWATHMQSKLPEEVTIADWEKAKQILDTSLVLDLEKRGTLYAMFDAPMRRLIESARFLRVAEVLPEERRQAYLEEATAEDADLRRTLLALHESGAEARPGSAERNLTMMSALKPTETFMLSMKLAFFAGIIVSFPFLLYFILQFVLPGLHDNERAILWPAMAVGFGLFLLGVLFAYFVVLPKTLVFFYQWSLDMGVANDWRIGEYITFTTQFTLLFGLSFELPVVVMAFVKLGMLSYEMMSRTRSYAVLAIVVASAMITPTSDLITLSLMAVPMYLLYETCIWLAYLDSRKRRREEEAENKARLERLLADEKEHHALLAAAAADTEEGEEEDRGDDPPPSAPASTTADVPPGGDHPDPYAEYHRGYDDHDEFGNPIHRDEQGRAIDEYGHLIDEKGRRVDEQGHLIDEYGHRIDEHGHMLEDDPYVYDHPPVDDPFADNEHPPLDQDGYLIDPESDVPTDEKPGEPGEADPSDEPRRDS